MTGPSPRSSAVAAGPQSSAMRTGDIVADPDIDDVQKRMDGALEALRREFQGLRTGRASIGLLEPIPVEAYGAKVPIADRKSTRLNSSHSCASRMTSYA